MASPGVNVASPLQGSEGAVNEAIQAAGFASQRVHESQLAQAEHLYSALKDAGDSIADGIMQAGKEATRKAELAEQREHERGLQEAKSDAEMQQEQLRSAVAAARTEIEALDAQEQNILARDMAESENEFKVHALKVAQSNEGVDAANVNRIVQNRLKRDRLSAQSAALVEIINKAPGMKATAGANGQMDLAVDADFVMNSALEMGAPAAEMLEASKQTERAFVGVVSDAMSDMHTAISEGHGDAGKAIKAFKANRGFFVSQFAGGSQAKEAMGEPSGLSAIGKTMAEVVAGDAANLGAGGEAGLRAAVQSNLVLPTLRQYAGAYAARRGVPGEQARVEQAIYVLLREGYLTTIAGKEGAYYDGSTHEGAVGFSRPDERLTVEEMGNRRPINVEESQARMRHASATLKGLGVSELEQSWLVRGMSQGYGLSSEVRRAQLLQEAGLAEGEAATPAAAQRAEQGRPGAEELSDVMLQSELGRLSPALAAAGIKAPTENFEAIAEAFVEIARSAGAGATPEDLTQKLMQNERLTDQQKKALMKTKAFSHLRVVASQPELRAAQAARPELESTQQQILETELEGIEIGGEVKAQKASASQVLLDALEEQGRVRTVKLSQTLQGLRANRQSIIDGMKQRLQGLNEDRPETTKERRQRQGGR